MHLLGFNGEYGSECAVDDDDDDAEEYNEECEKAGFDSDCAGVTQDMQDVLNKLKIAMRQPSLSNTDLTRIVNGDDGDEFDKRPFESTFTKEKIIRCFRRVVYTPFTRECLNIKYI